MSRKPSSAYDIVLAPMGAEFYEKGVALTVDQIQHARLVVANIGVRLHWTVDLVHEALAMLGLEKDGFWEAQSAADPAAGGEDLEDVQQTV